MDSSDPKLRERDDESVWARHQALLPLLPLPPLNATLERYLEFVTPLLSADELSATRRAVSASRAPLAALHAELERRRAAAGRTTSYVKPHWDDMYLGGRYAIPINSNPGLLFRRDPRRPSQCARAASLLVASFEWHRELVRGTIAPDEMGGRPCCMDEYSRVLAAARIPRAGRDEWWTAEQGRAPPRHVVVLCSRGWYEVECVRAGAGAGAGADAGVGAVAGAVRSEASIAAALASIVRREADKEGARALGGGAAPPPLGVLSSQLREEWAASRSLLAAAGDGRNARLLERVDSALLVLVLEPGPATGALTAAQSAQYAREGAGLYSERMATLLHGGGVGLGRGRGRRAGRGVHASRAVVG
eukprot:g7548.t1